jgi:hypothetical protein
VSNSSHQNIATKYVTKMAANRRHSAEIVGTGNA